MYLAKEYSLFVQIPKGIPRGAMPVVSAAQMQPASSLRLLQLAFSKSASSAACT